ncbi:unnamed protein product [Acanthoscelides obtectus]|uniref:Uncharacterized protein n=1 Tax=Acanthoscelides obtectus TaxID=200917 RepID=A0A9P0QAQ7_ACAOB|nr:unnamed protein product [Acanthoscelides obtectus]CAK1630448.1 hypothetical protein AOBTE_LOCUS6337 [Acanthoscelides obtectus]
MANNANVILMPEDSLFTKGHLKKDVNKTQH